MQPQTRPDRVRWLAHTAAGLALEIRSVEGQLRAPTAGPPLAWASDRRLAVLLLGQLRLMTRQCALLRDKLHELGEDEDPPPPNGPAGADG